MTVEEIKALFPLKAMITQDIIDNSDVNDCTDCIGANTLKSVLPEELKKYAQWCITYEWGKYGTDELICITTIEGVDMMKITEPMEVTFIIEK